MIIIEGTDLLGKTTLARELLTWLHRCGFPHVYCHFTKLSIGFDRYWHYLPWINRYSVTDRFYMSRVAYGRALNNQDVCTHTEMKMLDAHVALVGGLTAVCVANDDMWLYNRCKSNPKIEMYNADEIVAVNRQFKDLLESNELSYDVVIRVEEDNWPAVHAGKIQSAYLTKQDQLSDVYDRRPSASLRPKVNMYDPLC